MHRARFTLELFLSDLLGKVRSHLCSGRRGSLVSLNSVLAVRVAVRVSVCPQPPRPVCGFVQSEERGLSRRVWSRFASPRGAERGRARQPAPHDPAASLPLPSRSASSLSRGFRGSPVPMSLNQTLLRLAPEVVGT